jgi:hypothetical protein
MGEIQIFYVTVTPVLVTDLNILLGILPSSEMSVFSILILWRARCRSTVNSGNACLQPLLNNATMEGTVVFFEVRSGNHVIQQ